MRSRYKPARACESGVPRRPAHRRVQAGGNGRVHGWSELGEQPEGELQGLRLAVGETVIVLNPLLPLAGVSIVMERERQQNDSLVNG